MKNCFNSSEQFKEKSVDYKIVTNIINQKIKASAKPPAMSCAGLITAYKEKVSKRPEQ